MYNTRGSQECAAGIHVRLFPGIGIPRYTTYFKKASSIPKTYVHIAYTHLMEMRRKSKIMHIMTERETKINT